MNANNLVVVLPYDANWPAIFEREAAIIKKALGDNCLAIYHVGSTSIPGMSAKPIIDMIPVVKDIQRVDAVEEAIRKLGYQVKSENGMLFRRFFTKNNQTTGFNIHVYEEGSGELDRLLKFRDWMCTHPQDAEDYANLKISLASQFPDDRLRYSMGKEEFITSIDKKTGFSGWRIVKALTDREWRAYHRIRKQEIFDVIGIEYDPEHYTLTDQSHMHLVLYTGAEVVGVAHIEWLNDTEAALRPFAIDQLYQRIGLGSIFLVNIEKWLKQQGCHLLKLHANPQAVGFYERQGYSYMPFDEDTQTKELEFVDLGKVL
jgi:GrpB-like predicted nucleotidyltransferase (UPF0157 family)/GNAT superfamily N-acetyltransferase